MMVFSMRVSVRTLRTPSMSDEQELGQGEGVGKPAEAQEPRQARQAVTKEQRKARLMAAAEAAIDELLLWEESAGRPNMTAIEEQVLALRHQLGVEMAQAVVNEQAARSGVERAEEAPCCPECGGPLINKGRRKRKAVTRLGTLETDRPYAYCPHCNRGVFPPGPSA
jgi:hypothetical protein